MGMSASSFRLGRHTIMLICSYVLFIAYIIILVQVLLCVYNSTVFGDVYYRPRYGLHLDLATFQER